MASLVAPSDSGQVRSGYRVLLDTKRNEHTWKSNNYTVFMGKLLASCACNGVLTSYLIAIIIIIFATQFY